MDYQNQKCLSQNRKGKLSPAQIEAIQKKSANLLIIVVCSLGFSFILLILAFKNLPIGLLFLLIITEAVTAGYIFSRLNRNKAIIDGQYKIKSATGLASISPTRQGNVLHLDNNPIEIHETQIHPFTPGKIYELYYIQETGTLLSYKELP